MISRRSAMANQQVFYIGIEPVRAGYRHGFQQRIAFLRDRLPLTNVLRHEIVMAVTSEIGVILSEEAVSIP